MLAVGKVNRHLIEHCLERRRLTEDSDRTTVPKGPANLFGGGRLVDRHCCATSRPDGVLNIRELIPGGRIDADPRTGLDSERNQTGGQFHDLAPEFFGGDIDEAIAVAVGKCSNMRMRIDSGEQSRNRTVTGRDFDGPRAGVLTHSFSSGRAQADAPG